MYNIVSIEYDQPTRLNSAITEYFEIIFPVLSEYADDAINACAFNNSSEKYVNRANNFLYLLAYLLIVMYENEVYENNNGSYMDNIDMWDDYYLNEIRTNFNILYGYDITDVVNLFLNYPSSITDEVTFGSSDSDVDFGDLI